MIVVVGQAADPVVLEEVDPVMARAMVPEPEDAEIAGLVKIK